jgi:hypothetical protein
MCPEDDSVLKQKGIQERWYNEERRVRGGKPSSDEPFGKGEKKESNLAPGKNPRVMLSLREMLKKAE